MHFGVSCGVQRGFVFCMGGGYDRNIVIRKSKVKETPKLSSPPRNNKDKPTN